MAISSSDEPFLSVWGRMAEKIYIRNASGELEPLTEERFETEELLQELIGQHPELLAGEQMRPDDPLRWILIKREMPIEGWALDHLLIDQHSRPTLVEVKRGSNREIRRNIVGQMLDYAATAASVWSQHNIRQVFEDAQDQPDQVISKLLGDDERDVDAFWEQVATNLDANRLRLLFVADEIPPELERVVKFLNEQTRDNLEVLAVEVKQYPGQFGDALVSRVIGQIEPLRDGATGATAGRRRSMTVDEFLGTFGADVQAAAEKLINDARRAGANIQGSPGGIRIGGRCSVYRNPINIAQFYCPTDTDEGQFTFRVGQGFDIPEVRVFLSDWIARFEQDDFVEKYEPTNWQTGWTVKPSDMAKHVDLLSARLCAALTGLRELQPSESD